MQIIRHLDALNSSLSGGAVSIGNFDGVHLGHAHIARQLAAQAKQYGGPAIVFTFDPHPIHLLRPEEILPPLTWTDRKAQLLAEQGVDILLAYPTDAALLALSPHDFFAQIVLGRLAPRGMVEGDNFRFGRGRAGDMALLRKLTAENGLDLDVISAVQFENSPVSSTRIRQLLSEGAIQAAAELLTQPYRLRGIVAHGAGRGGPLGFPTANLEALDTLLPAPGVYAGRGFRQEKVWPAAIHIGPNPTFADATSKVEVHLIGCDETLYGSRLEVDFLTRLRDIERFSDAAALKRQLALDVEKTRCVAAGDV